ncbi:hypothetical protein [Isoptericola sp. BMS4]|uniref:hypothetical protein n=1 Tax=Isoptericola sp. BMS4 TaxID=2527875 RepID=UPI001421CBB7|nr:hypothetical protein [Isoptericola sp. BMS4]
MVPVLPTGVRWLDASLLVAGAGVAAGYSGVLVLESGPTRDRLLVLAAGLVGGIVAGAWARGALARQAAAEAARRGVVPPRSGPAWAAATAWLLGATGGAAFDGYRGPALWVLGALLAVAALQVAARRMPRPARPIQRTDRR